MAEDGAQEAREGSGGWGLEVEGVGGMEGVGGAPTLKFRSELCSQPGGGWPKANAHSLPDSQEADLRDLAKLTPKGGGGSAPAWAAQTC